jgi:hypothetical protein
MAKAQKNALEKLLDERPTPWMVKRFSSSNRIMTADGELFDVSHLFNANAVATIFNAYASLKAERDALAEAVKAADELERFGVFAGSDAGTAHEQFKAARAKVKP